MGQARKIYFNTLFAHLRVFGFKNSFWKLIFVIPPLYIFTHLTLLLDNIFFHKHSTVTVNKPVFIIGAPRSGATFLHHLLTNTNDLIGFKAWHIIFPALTARIIFKPFIKLAIKLNRTELCPESTGHGIFLDQNEEEEFLFLNKLDTQFAIITSALAFDDKEYPELRFCDQQPEAHRKSSVLFLKKCFQRQIYYMKKERIVAQTHFSSHRVSTLLEIFPDAKFIHLVRSPLETIPSHLSLNRNILDLQWGLNNIPPNRLRRYYFRRYKYDADIYHYLRTIKVRPEFQNNLLTLRYDDLITNLYESFERINEFIELEPSEELKSTVKTQAAKQKDYVPKHKVLPLEDFGLTTDKIIKDLSFVFDEYNFTT